MPACANCGAELRGEYCHACGQSVVDPLRSLRAFIKDAIGDVAHLHSGTLLTLRTLFKPGRLTRAYITGKRARYVGPLQLYFLCAAIFFAAGTFSPVVSFDAETRSVRSSFGMAAAGGNIGEAEVAALEARGISLPLFQERFINRVNSALPVLLIVSLAIFTLSMQLFYIRQQRNLVVHAVFALHWSSFFLLLIVLERVLSSLLRSGRLVPVFITFAGLAYLLLALRHVYGQSRLVTLIKGFWIYIVFNAFLAAWVVGVVAYAYNTI